LLTLITRNWQIGFAFIAVKSFSMVTEQNEAAPKDREIPTNAYLSLVVGLVVIGFSPILIRLAEAPGPVSGFYRMAIGWLLLTPWFIQRQRKQRSSARALRPSIIAGLLFGGDMVLWTTGVMLAGATIPTLFANTSPLWVGLGALVLFREKLKTGFWTGLLLALGGAVMILGVGETQNEYLLEGVLLGLGSAIFYGSYFLAGQRGREELDPLTFLWVVSFFCSLVLLAAVVVLKQPLTGYPLQSYLAFLAMGVVIQILGWWLISSAQGKLPASLVAPTMLGQPVLTALLAVPLLGEKLSWLEILGGITVIIGIYIVHRSKQHKKEA
jgi:drug/metabolite transporter (DMT)-like permease